MGHGAHAVCPYCGGHGFTMGEANLDELVRAYGTIRRMRTTCGKCQGMGMVFIEIDGMDYLPQLTKRGITQEKFLFPTEERLLRSPEDIVRLAEVAELTPPKADTPGERAMVVQNGLYVYQVAYGNVPLRISGPGDRTLPPATYARALQGWYQKYHVVTPRREEARHERPDPITLEWAKSVWSVKDLIRGVPRKEK